MAKIDKPEKLPSVDRLLNDPHGALLVQEFGLSVVTECVQTVLAEGRKKVLAGTAIEHG